MSYLDHIRACNAHDLSGFRPFAVAGVQVGWVRHGLAERLADVPEVFSVAETGVALTERLADPESRSAAVAEVVARLAQAGDLPPQRGELYPVVTRWGAAPLLTLDRAAVPCFGVTSFGLHVNGYVTGLGPPELWIGRRARDRGVAPGKFDNLVAGGQPHGISLRDNLVKEAEEEAGLSRDLALTARPVGAITYTMEVPEGLKRDVLFLYDLELPREFKPENGDGEVEAFFRWPLPAVAARVRDTFDFKFNVNLVIIDFLIRHSFLTPDEPDYLELVKGLRQ